VTSTTNSSGTEGLSKASTSYAKIYWFLVRTTVSPGVQLTPLLPLPHLMQKKNLFKIKYFKVVKHYLITLKINTFTIFKTIDTTPYYACQSGNVQFFS